MPRGHEWPEEARLEFFGREVLSGDPRWSELTAWWLHHAPGANTPNWDIAVSCDIEGRTGFVLVEAKANVPELSAAGKPISGDASVRSISNHARIGAAIAEARDALATQFADIAISRDSHYQMSNRIAFAWKLASLGIPVLLVYVGFTGDSGIRDVGEPLQNDEHWRQVFSDHMKAVAPLSMLERRIQAGPAAFWILSRSRQVAEISPAAARRSV